MDFCHEFTPAGVTTVPLCFTEGLIMLQILYDMMNYMLKKKASLLPPGCLQGCGRQGKAWSICQEGQGEGI
jgi:hypothetical protein